MDAIIFCYIAKKGLLDVKKLIVLFNYSLFAHFGYHSKTQAFPIDTLRVPIAPYIKSYPFRLIPKLVGTIEWE